MALQQLTDSRAAPSVSAVALKLPEFWQDDPEVWFARVEAQFNTKGITTDGTKFDHVVGALDNATAQEIKAILCHPPERNKYTALKNALIEAFGKSQTQKDNELLSISGLGDRKPSSLLRQIRSLNSDAETLRRAFFLAQLPAETRSILASHDIQDLDELAKMADRVLETRTAAPTGATFALTHQRRSERPQYQRQAKTCHWHNRFGMKARRCEPGCPFSELLEPPRKSGNEGAGRE